MKTRHLALIAIVILHDVLTIGFVTWLAPPAVIEALSATEHALMGCLRPSDVPMVVIPTSTIVSRVGP